MLDTSSLLFLIFSVSWDNKKSNKIKSKSLFLQHRLVELVLWLVTDANILTIKLILYKDKHVDE